MNHKIGIAVIRSRTAIDKNEFIPPVIIDQSGRRVDVQRCPPYDQHIGVPDELYRSIEYILIEALLIQHDVGADHTAAAAAGNVSSVIDHIRGIGLAAFGTIGSQDAAVQLEHILASGRLMEPVDVLRDNSTELAFLFQLREP